MSLQIILTKDGSHSIATGSGVTYHSTFGALQESEHIFIRAGLRPLPGGPMGRVCPEAFPEICPEAVPENGACEGGAALPVFEMGFGTGLNCLLTLREAEATGRAIRYETVDTTPLPMEIVRQLNYCSLLGRPDLQPVFEWMHEAPWDRPVEVAPGFTMLKALHDGRGYRLREPARVVYYDAFDPVVQPELWTQEVFENLIRNMMPGAVLVTYCCKGAVRRAMRQAGFSLEKLPGPPGKREMLRAHAKV